MKLVRFKQGVDGLKTGYTKESGYCLTATMKQGNMRVIAVVMGEVDSNTRNNEVSGMLDYAFSQYSIDTLYTKNTIVDKLKLDKSNIESVGVVPIDDVVVLYKKVDGKKSITYDIEYDNIKSIIKKGDVIGRLILKENGKKIKEAEITVNRNVEKASYWDLFCKNLENIITGNIFVPKKDR